MPNQRAELPAMEKQDYTTLNASASRFARSICWSAAGRVTLLRLVLDLVEIQHHIAVSTQVALESVERYSHHITMMNFLTSWDLAALEPYLVNQTNVLIGKTRRVRPKVINFLAIVRPYDLEAHLPARR